ncbi:metallophosphoesterase [Aequorivita antarctica]|uniref:Metallophosphoesterase n=1 Tax=Aequorivita antarctica TaxID=153266 RepID=A0A5C6Z666_9FLAO|nr:metallophosphoesterase [Aequorivita antarctica]TXD75011.1 metallophosphoesterase [Aequorivita antarctica]SRX72260.1 3',5'-cyclic adenosine monophosphate phosphodiesterase CpdA [Aequorivita antarctica]
MRWFIFIVIYILVDIYAFQAVKTVAKSPWLHGFYVFISLAVLAGLIYELSFLGSAKMMEPPKMYFFGIFLAVFIPKLILIIFMFGEDIGRFFVGIFMKVAGSNEASFMASRRKFVSTIALGIAAIPFASLIYGMVQGKYNYKVLKYALEFDDLPDEFDGFTLTQISDIHSGSFDNHNKVEYAVNLINEQQGDVILFTGDLVNNVASEMDDWKQLFSTLKAPQGVYSVLGNHDYGDYVNWESANEKALNLEKLKLLQKEMGWDLLLNENRYLEKNGQRIALVGVENWGLNGFKQIGDLDKACEGISENDFKILMSHDPSHWQAKVKEDPRHFHLTLSGHTHGMQFGIEIPGIIKWSPIKYRYKNWAGIYEEFGRYINVNRGFGFLGYPGRVGIWPEITVIQLKKKQNTV